MNHIHTGTDLDHWLFFLLRSSSSKLPTRELWLMECSLPVPLRDEENAGITRSMNLHVQNGITQTKILIWWEASENPSLTLTRKNRSVVLDLRRTLCLRNESSDWGIVLHSNILTFPPLKMNQVWFQTIWSSWKLLISSPPFSCWASCLLSWEHE